MLKHTKIASTLLSLLVAAAATATAADREWPENKFECQVVTESGARGLVSIQTTTRQQAAKTVLDLLATTDKDTIEKTESVVQCIDIRKNEDFSDLGFRSWRSNLVE